MTILSNQETRILRKLARLLETSGLYVESMTIDMALDAIFAIAENQIWALLYGVGGILRYDRTRDDGLTAILRLTESVLLAHSFPKERFENVCELVILRERQQVYLEHALDARLNSFVLVQARKPDLS